MLEQIIVMLEEILEIDPGTVKAEDEFREYEGWDSLAYLSVIAKIDEDYHMVIPRDEFRELRTVGALAEYVEVKK
jgi:acyl carrier protein